MKRIVWLCFAVLLTALSLSIVSAQEGDEDPVSPNFFDEKFQLMQAMSLNDDGTFMMFDGPSGNTIYEVFVRGASGSFGTYSARTGAGHPVPGANVLFGGSGGGTTTNFSTVRSYTSNTDYTQINGRGVVAPFTNEGLDPYFVNNVPLGATGFRTTWRLPGPTGNPASSDNLQIVQDITVIGASLNDSRIELKTSVTNLGPTPAQIGIRYLWDYQIGSDDGPSFTQVNPDVAALLTETTFTPAGFEFYQIEDNNTVASPVFSVSGTANGPNALDPTLADSIKFTCWPTAFGTAFDYTTTGRDCSTGSGDTAVLYYFGATSSTAPTLTTGQTLTVTEYMFAIPPTINPPPVAEDDNASTTPPAPVTITVLANDFDLNGDALTVTTVTAPSSGTAVINADGTITYTPNAGATGTDTFIYTISDGTSTDTATVTISLNNRPPLAVDDSATTNINTPVTIPVLANDSEPEGQTLTLSAVNTPSVGTAVQNPDGTVTYTPPAGFVGQATFSYVISDGTQQDDATVTVNVINRPPTALDDTATTNVATPVIVPVLANDTDPDGQALSVTGVTVPSVGTAAINPDGTITYTPPALFVGAATFQYTISDGFDSATANVTVNVINRAPSAVDDLTSTPMNTPVIVSVLTNDSDTDGHPLTVTAVSVPANGTAVINPDGTVTYTPNSAFLGTDTFTYTISDGYDTATATVTINVVENCGDADRNPELHLDHEESLLLVDAGYRTGRIVNRSLNCSYEVGIASYRMFDNVIDNQELFDFETVVIPPGGTLELTIDLPACATQVDLFYGVLLTSLIGQRYGDRLIDGLQLNLPNFCAVDGVPEIPVFPPTEP